MPELNGVAGKVKKDISMAAKQTSRTGRGIVVLVVGDDVGDDDDDADHNRNGNA
jgi:hypothetical protein